MIKITPNVQHFPIQKSLLILKIELLGDFETRAENVKRILKYAELCKDLITENKEVI